MSAYFRNLVLQRDAWVSTSNCAQLLEDQVHACCARWRIARQHWADCALPPPPAPPHARPPQFSAPRPSLKLIASWKDGATAAAGAAAGGGGITQLLPAALRPLVVEETGLGGSGLVLLELQDEAALARVQATLAAGADAAGAWGQRGQWGQRAALYLTARAGALPCMQLHTWHKRQPFTDCIKPSITALCL